MTQDEVGALISYIGIVLQLVGSLLLAGLFSSLHRHARRRTYFTVWGWAWGAVSVAIGALALALGPLADLPGDGTIARGLYALYQWQKLVFCGLLVLGTRLYARGMSSPLRKVLALLLAGSAAFAFGSVSLAGDLDALVGWQAPLLAIGFGYCAITLLLLPRSRSSFGSNRTGAVFGTITALWVLYTWSFNLVRVGAPPPVAFELLLAYNSYIDLLLQLLLGYAMVVLVLEDAMREADDARNKLELVHDQLKREAFSDVLTGALNRRAFGDGVGLQLARAKFGSVAVLDLDNLKEVNDVHGHASGDVLLRHLADTLHGRLRVSDALYRLGGDEFLVVLAGARAGAARRVVDGAIADAGVVSTPDGRADLSLAVSVGVSEYRGGEDLRGALQRADRDMYREKSSRKQAARAARASGSRQQGAAAPDVTRRASGGERELHPVP
ncbi:MAG: GGDEF domain-containing protein [Gemmatimonadota bacterium]